MAVTREGVVLPGAMARLMTNKVLGTWHDRVFIFGFHHSNSLMIDDGRWVWWTIWRQGTVPDITRLFIVLLWLIEDYSIVDYSWRVVDKVCPITMVTDNADRCQVTVGGLRLDAPLLYLHTTLRINVVFGFAIEDSLSFIVLCTLPLFWIWKQM